MQRPQSLEDYLIWAEGVIACYFGDPKTQKLYDINLINIYNTVIKHSFFVGFSNKAKEWEAYYESRTKSNLFMGNGDPNLQIKPYDSVVEKTYRKNILWNRNYPKPPQDGWYASRNLYSRLNDLVRGTLVCRFIDGPSFVAQAIKSYANEHGLQCRQYSQEREDGYYAFHVYISFPVTIVDGGLNEEQVLVQVEIQITTQLQEVLRTLTHQFYKTQRLAVSADRGDR